ncbi:MAG: putative porin, partial [Bacteroidota bacterium]
MFESGLNKMWFHSGNSGGKLKQALCLAFILLFAKAGQAQVFYSTNPAYIQSKTEGNNLSTVFKNNYPDTAIQNYHQTMPVNFMGNIGLPSPNLLMQYGSDKIGFRFFDLPYKNDLFSEKNVHYTVSKGPYASLSGLTGSKQFQAGKINYTQTYANRLSLSLNFDRLTSQGFYLRQQSFATNFVAASHYTNKKNNFGFYTFIINNGNKNQENGGIKDVVLNDSTAKLNKQLMAVRLTNASHDNRQTKLMFNPWLKLFSKHDSANRYNHYLQVKSQIDFNALKYKDLNVKGDKYYQTIKYDSLKTNDSSNFRQINNSIAYTLQQKNNHANFSLGYKNQINKVWQKHDSTFANHLLFSEFNFRTYDAKDTLWNQGLETAFNIDYVIQGKNAGNYKVENKSIYYLNRNQNKYLFLNAFAEKRNADYFYNTWRSNHFVWNNTFAAQEQAQIQTGIQLGNGFSFSCMYQNIFKYLYVDNEAKPAQLLKTIDNFAASLQYNQVFFKHLGFSFSHIYQSTSKAKYYRVPENISSAKLFYDGSLFKNNLNLQIGSQITVYQSFK